jgi:hypothetical protein
VESRQHFALSLNEKSRNFWLGPDEYIGGFLFFFENIRKNATKLNEINENIHFLAVPLVIYLMVRSKRGR